MKLATPADIAYIDRAMWARGREELKRLGIDRESWWLAWINRIARADAVSFGEAILGCDWVGPGTVETAFQASESFEKPAIGKAVTKEMRRMIPQLMEGRGIRVFNTYSLCIDPSAEKWFRLLGLEEDKSFRGTRGPYTLRRFFRSV